MSDRATDDRLWAAYKRGWDSLNGKPGANDDTRHLAGLYAVAMIRAVHWDTLTWPETLLVAAPSVFLFFEAGVLIARSNVPWLGWILFVIGWLPAVGLVLRARRTSIRAGSEEDR